MVGWWYRSDGQAIARGINTTRGGVARSSSRCGVTPASFVEHTVVVIEARETDGMTGKWLKILCCVLVGVQ